MEKKKMSKKMQGDEKDRVLEQVASKLDTYTAEGRGVEKYSVELKNWLEQQEGVAKATLRGRNTITVEFDDGSRVGVLLDRRNNYAGCGREYLPVSTMARAERMRDVRVSTMLELERAAQFTVAKWRTPGSKKALLFDPLYDDWPPEDTTNSIETSLIDAGYSVDRILGEDGDLAHLASIESERYGVIFIRSHGGVLFIDGDDKIHVMTRPFFDSWPDPADSGYTGIEVFFLSTNWGMKYAYAFNDEFVRHHLGAAQFPDTLMHLLVCHGGDPLGIDDMVDAFLDFGVGCYTGWTRNASLAHGDPAAVAFFDYLCSGHWRTVNGAINYIESLGHSPDPGTGADLVGYGSCATMMLKEPPTIVLDIKAKELEVLKQFPKEFVEVLITPPEGMHIPDWSPWGGKFTPVDRAGARRFIPNLVPVRAFDADSGPAGMYEAIDAYGLDTL